MNLNEYLATLDPAIATAENGSFVVQKYPYHIDMSKCLKCNGPLGSPSDRRIGCQKCDYSHPASDSEWADYCALQR